MAVRSKFVFQYTPMLLLEGLTDGQVEKVKDVLKPIPDFKVKKVTVVEEADHYMKDGYNMGLIPKGTYMVWIELPETIELDTSKDKLLSLMDGSYAELVGLKSTIEDDARLGLRLGIV